MVITSTRWKGKWLVVVDFHTHILPVIDDGSHSISESVTLLRMQMHQGVRAVVATPHFYADQNSPEAFLEKRNRVWRQLAPYLWPELPKVYLGAEVQYFEGIASVEEISLLKIEGSDLLLLEMPFHRWTERMIDDVLEINGRSGVQVVLAHIERYLTKQPKAVWQHLRDNDVLMQSNVSFFADWKTRHKAMCMLANGEIHILGSDCHDKTKRPPNWDLLPDKAVQVAKDSTSYLSFERNIQKV